MPARAPALPAAVAALAVLLLPGLAQALSCLPPDPVRLYQRAADAEERYLVVHGAFDAATMEALRPAYPGGYSETLPPQRDIEGLTFTGQAMTSGGFDFDIAAPVTLRLNCIGPWCTSVPGGDPMLAFLQVVPGGYLLALDACGGFAMQGVDAAGLDRVLTCHRGGPCVETPWE